MATLDGDGDNSSCSWSLATNWTIAGGSLDTAVTFESFDSPIDSETVDADVKPPLVLKPPSRDCAPCEIKLSFTQKHEVRQVYVRSTARVYEIYFAPSLRSSNEYLCTVRCGVAARDDEVLHTTGSEESAGVHSKESAGELAKEKSSDDANNASSEEDWIEVKVPDSLLQNKHNSAPEKNDDNPRTRIQEFYEATAEITDADACISLILRLLSLQNKGCLYVDEIYVFADPVESADSETQASQMGNLAGSSFMGMLVPTLLQLSKTGSDRGLDKHAAESPDTLEKGEQLEVGSRVSYSSIIPKEIQQDESIAAQHDVKLQIPAHKAKPAISQFQIPAQVSNTEPGHSAIKTDVPYDRMESALEELVSRVSKIEDICLRFEENILKPISSIEARLQQVEQQVEKLSKNSQYSGLPSCSRISAPTFSCSGSNSSSFNNEGSDYPACGALGLEKKDIPCNKLFNPPDDISISVNGAQFLPSLVVTAPEFSNGDEEENSDILEPTEDGPREKMKKALSIDDALAAALAGFLSTTGVQPSDYTQTLSVKAPEFSVDEIGDDDEVVSATHPSDKPVVALMFSCGSNAAECTCNSVSTPRSTSSVLDMGNFGDECFKETSEGVDGQDQLDVGCGSCRSLGNSVNSPTTKDEVGLAQTDDCQNAGPTHTAEASDEISLSVSEATDIPKQLVGIQTEDTSDALQEGAAASAKDVAEGTEEDILQKAFKSSSASCVVDFELPILDVKFASSETPTSTAKSPLEALLTNMPESDVDTPRVQQRDGEMIREQSNLILAEDGEPNCNLTGRLLLVDWDDYDCGDATSSRDATSSVEVKACQDSYTGKNPEMSLI